NVGMMQFRLGQCAQAAETLHEALETGIRRMGETHPGNLRTRYNYGTALACAGDFTAGATHIRAAAEAIESAPRPNHEEAAAAWEKLARLHLDRREPDAALTLLDRIDAQLAKVPDPPLYWAGRAATLRANALLQQDDAGAALALLDTASEVAARNLDAELPVETALLRALAAARLNHAQAGEYARAGRALLAALPM